jgi:hypothetical protein
LALSILLNSIPRRDTWSDRVISTNFAYVRLPCFDSKRNAATELPSDQADRRRARPVIFCSMVFRVPFLVTATNALLVGVCACGAKSAATASDDAGSPAADGSQPAPIDAGAAGLDGQLPLGSLLVDDQSNSLGEISLPNGGYWYTYPVVTAGTITPTPKSVFFFTPVDAGSFSRAACVTASDITTFGAGSGFAFQLSMPDGALSPFDASAYSHVSFYAMSSDSPDMIVSFADINTLPQWPGATCAGGADAGPVPDGGYPMPPCGHYPQAAVALSPTWQQVNLAFANVSGFKAPGFYVPAAVNSGGLLYMIFGETNPNYRVDGRGPLSFHICVAQIYLTP